MSVLINGMKMPEIKENKSIKAEIRNLDGRLELGIMTGGYYCCEQWLYYPIIEVPDGHGDLIDKYRLIDGILYELGAADAIGDKEEYAYWERVLTYVRKSNAIIPSDKGET